MSKNRSMSTLSTDLQLDQLCRRLRSRLVTNTSDDHRISLTIDRLWQKKDDDGDKDSMDLCSTSRSSSPCPPLHLSESEEEEEQEEASLTSSSSPSARLPCCSTSCSPMSSSSSPSSSSGSIRSDMSAMLQEASRILFDVSPLVVRLIPAKTKSTRREYMDLVEEEGLEKMPEAEISEEDDGNEWCVGWNDHGEAVSTGEPIDEMYNGKDLDINNNNIMVMEEQMTECEDEDDEDAILEEVDRKTEIVKEASNSAENDDDEPVLEEVDMETELSALSAVEDTEMKDKDGGSVSSFAWWDCVICYEILVRPAKLFCCNQHVICGPCFQRHLDEVGRYCPFCLKRIGTWRLRQQTEDDMLVDRELERKVQEHRPAEFKARMKRL